MTDKIKNMTIDECVSLISDPKKSSQLTWGEFIQIMDVVEKTQRIANNQMGCADLEVELKRLKKRVCELENTILAVRMALGGEEDD